MDNISYAINVYGIYAPICNYHEYDSFFNDTYYDSFAIDFSCPSGYVPQYSSCVLSPDRGSSPPPNYCAAGSSQSVGDPTSVGSGSLYEEVVDFDTAGSQPLRLKRYYEANSVTGYYLGDSRWHFDFEYTLLVSSGLATLITPQGATYQFIQNGSQWNIQNSEGPITLTGSSTGQYTVTMQDGTSISFVSGAGGSRYKISSIARSDGLTLTFSYAPPFISVDILSSITDNYGRSFSFSPAASNASAIASAVYNAGQGGPDAFQVSYGYSSTTSQGFTYNRMLTSVTRSSNPSGSSPANWQQVDGISYLYQNTDYPFLMTGAIDQRGIQTSAWTFDATARTLSSNLADNLDPTTITYNDTNQSRAVTNSLGKQFTYGFGASKGLMLLNTASSAATTHTPASTRSVAYDANSNIAQEIDEEGRVTTFSRDGYGRPTQIVRGAGTPSAATRAITWSPTLGLPTQIVDPGLTTAYVWTASGQLTSLTETDTTTQSAPYSTNGQSRTWTYTYNANGALASVRDPANQTTSYTYNAAGFLQTVTDQLGHVTTVTAWNSRGQPASVMDPNGVVTNIGYDDIGRVVTVAVDVGSQSPATTIIAWSVAGDITKITEPNGAWQAFAYDDARRLTTVTDSLGNAVSYVRDTMGNATQVTVTRADQTIAYTKSQVFDELGRLIQSIGATPGTWTYGFGYDKTDNLVSITDPRSNTFSYGFDALNRLIQEIDEESATVNLTRNGVDDITAYQDPRNLTTSYVRNGFGEAIQETSPDRGTTVYARDARGLVTQRIDGRGIVTNYTYDAAGRPLTISYLGHSGDNVSFTWDQPATGSYPIGHLTTIADGAGTTVRAYDAKGRVSSETRTIGSAPPLTISYSRDLSGNITDAIYPSGDHFVWNRDKQGRVQELAYFPNGSTTWTDLINTVAWNPWRPVRTLAFANGLTASFGLDTDYRINAVNVAPSSGPAILDRALSWVGDTLGQITDSVTSSNSETLGYTPTRRLASASGPYGAYAWTYDPVGNRASEALAGTTTAYNYPSTSNQLANLTQGATTVRSFGYDADGNVASDTKAGGPWTYGYDSEGRLIQATAGSSVVGTYVYDGLWRLAKRMAAAGETHYLQDDDGHIVAETDANGNTLREYVWLGDMPVAVIDAVNTATPATYYVHTDHLLRPVTMTDASGTTVWNAVYKPFGEALSITGTLVMNARFPGQWFQLETGLHYNWHRYYDATTGRYQQPDSMGLGTLLVGGPSRYGYARQAPFGWVDPSGRTAAGASAGAWWGGLIAGVAGAETGPGDIPIELLGSAAGAALGDWLTGARPECCAFPASR